MSRNPDSDFVLHGRRTPVSKPKEYLTNSQRTISTRNLSQNTFYRPDSRNSSRYTGRSFFGTTQNPQNIEKSHRKDDRRLQDSTSESVFDAESLFGSMNGGTLARQERRERSRKPRDSELSLDFTGLGNSLSKSLSKSVSFSEHLEQYKTNGSKSDDDDLEDTFEEELQKLIDNDIKENDQYEQDLAGKPKSKYESKWYTEPVHLTKPTDYPVFHSLGVDTTRSSPVNRTVGILGTELAQQKIANQMLLDDIARDYFPVTLGEIPSILRTVTPQPPNSIGKKYARAHSAVESQSSTHKRGRVTSATRPTTQLSNGQSSHSKASNPKLDALHDYNYLRASKPFVEDMVMTSPYQYELAQLKMERLRLEEQRLLESKRQEELERIRGPTPKWYELKTPQFTYELHKNNKLLESKKDWQNLMDYRDQLTRSSQDFAQTELGGYFH